MERIFPILLNTLSDSSDEVGTSIFGFPIASANGFTLSVFILSNPYVLSLPQVLLLDLHLLSDVCQNKESGELVPSLASLSLDEDVTRQVCQRERGVTVPETPSLITREGTLSPLHLS